MRINLLEIIKNLPVSNYDKIGYAVGFIDIYEYLHIHHGVDNQDFVMSSLNQLSSEGLIKLHRMEYSNDEADIIIAVSII